MRPATPEPFMDSRAWTEPRGAPGTILVWLEATLAAEFDRWFLWLPVVFAAGILAYFGLSDEPGWALVAALVLGSAGVCALLPRRNAVALAAAGLIVAGTCGFVAAKLRTEWVRSPVLARDMWSVEITGFVEERERRPQARTRVLLRVLSVAGLPAEKTPYRLRVSVPATQAAGLGAGDAVKLKATLKPPPEPSIPGGFDFARRAYFERIGGVGFAAGALERLADAPRPPSDLSAWALVDRLRDRVEARILAVVSGPAGEVSNALITGRRGNLSEAVVEAYQNSGLAHVLSISGLHMATMAGSLFWLVRALLALSPALALRYPIRKIAATVALVGALFYLGLSGASVPTQRSWLMLSVLFVAVLLDRPALTLRNVALAALLILCVAPEMLFDVSFEMSFAAVTALVAVYERIARREKKPMRERGSAGKVVRWLGMALLASTVTTLVASAAVAPFGIYYFQRLTHYAILANLLATPVVTFLIMPMALLALIAMPLGFEAWPLIAMNEGVRIMTRIAEWVAAWPGAVSHIPTIPASALTLIAFGGLWLCLWQRRWRAFGMIIVAAGLAFSPTNRLPDILIEREGKSIALRAPDGRLALPPDARSSYSAAVWLAADGDPRSVAQAANSPASYRCDSLGCIAVVKGKTVALVRDPAALEEDCRRADIVVAPFSLGSRCRAARFVLDRKRLSSEGAQALYLDGQSIVAETVRSARGARPWVSESRRYPPIAIGPPPSLTPAAAAAPDDPFGLDLAQ